MPYRLLADIVVIIHFVFVIFALFGGILVLKWKQVIWIHIPAVIWAAMVEMAGWVCPLTPLEYWLRSHLQMSSYQLSFVEHYILPILYPAQLTRSMQIGLGLFVVLINVAIYYFVWKRHFRKN